MAALGSAQLALRVRAVGIPAARTTMAGRVATVYHQVVASWYGPGGTTACGEQLGAGTLGVANRTLPCGTKVTLRLGSRVLTVPVIDRGPYVAGRDYDLTYATKVALGAGDVVDDLGERLRRPAQSGQRQLDRERSAPACRASSSKEATRTPSRRTGRGGA